jgi:hypothetical protein
MPGKRFEAIGATARSRCMAGASYATMAEAAALKAINNRDH